MKTLLTSLLIIIASTTKAQKFSDAYKSGDELYVCSAEGISLRPAPDAKSTKIMVLQFGTPLKVLADTSPRVKFVSTGVPGTWVKVTVLGGSEGYVFDGFISRIKPMGPREEGDYASNRSTAIVDHLKATFKVKTEMKSDKSFEEKWIVTFTNGVTFNASYASIIEIGFPSNVFTFQEAFLFARSIYPMLFGTCPYKENEFVCVVQDEAIRVRKDAGANTFTIVWSQGD